MFLEFFDVKKRFQAKQEKNQAINSRSKPTPARFQAKQETIFEYFAPAIDNHPSNPFRAFRVFRCLNKEEFSQTFALFAYFRNKTEETAQRRFSFRIFRPVYNPLQEPSQKQKACKNLFVFLDVYIKKSFRIISHF